MEINRRHFLGGLALLPVWLQAGQQPHQTHSPLFASATRVARRQYELCLFDLQGQALARQTLPARAHQVLAHPDRPWLFSLARRPGQFIAVYDYQQQTDRARLTPQPGYTFCGHAQVSVDGRYLYTSEVRPDQQGTLVVRDMQQNFQPVAELATHGLDPHEFRWLPDRQTLVVANGGILTRGRDKLNLDRMQPSLVYLRARDGQVLQQVSLPPALHQCSIRHLAVAADGEVICALQYEGHPADQVPLVLSHRLGEALQPLYLPEHQREQLKQYCGSVCLDRSQRYAAISAPRGDLLLLWDRQEARWLDAVPAVDVCGIAATPIAGEFLASTGYGQLYRVQAASGARQPLAWQQPSAPWWDNHLTAL